MPKTEEKVNGYFAVDDKNRNQVISMYASANKFEAIQRTKGALSDTARTRHAYDSADYYRQRPNDALPGKFKDVINACRASYLSVNVVRNVIDLMTDFACEDVKIVHPDKEVEAFFKVWMAKINLKEAIDEFVRHFLVDGNVVVRRKTAKLSKPVEEQWTQRAMSRKEVVPEPEKLYKETKVAKREIPWGYTFLNITALQWIGGEAAQAVGKKQLAFKPSDAMLAAIKNPQDTFQKTLVDRIPSQVRRSIVSGNTDLIELDMDTIYVAHNKKDSWEDWAPPFLYSILADLKFKDKLRQAEMSALDGIINVIRLWKLGDHAEGFLPGDAPIQKLVDILEANTGGGAIDIVWDSMISMEEFYPPVDKILGSEKYQQVNRDILIGLGVPEVLIGGHGANFSNSWIQLKTLVEKLNYVRDRVKDWLYEEVHAVCEAMDIAVAPKVRFNQVNLEDNNVTKKLIVDLLDRGIVSVEAVLNAYGEDFLIEVERKQQEDKVFKKAGIEPKGPFDMEPEVPAAPLVRKKKKNPRQPGPGRPSQTQDVSRKTRRAKPRRAAASQELTLKGLEIIDLIDKVVVPSYMDSINVANARKLTSEQRDDINSLRSFVLSAVKPDDELTDEYVLTIADDADKRLDVSIVQVLTDAVYDFTERTGQVPTVEQRKRIEAIAWADYHAGE